MQQVGDLAEHAVPGRRRARGRQDRSGQEKVINKKELADRMPHLINLRNTARDAGKDYSSAVKTCAEQSGLLASTVRKLVEAKAGNSFDEKRKEAEQLAFMFDEIG